MIVYDNKELTQESFNQKDAYQCKCLYAGGRAYGAKEVLAWCDAFPEEAVKLGLINIDELMTRFRELSTLLLEVIKSKDSGNIRGRVQCLSADARRSLGTGVERETLMWLIKQLQEVADGGNHGK